MELTEAMRTTGTCRYFRPDPVPDEVLRARVRRRPLRPAGRQPPAGALDRRAGRGGKQALAELYLPLWKAYFNAVATGDVNVGRAPRDRARRRLLRRALRGRPRDRRRLRGAGGAAPHRHRAGPALGRRRRRRSTRPCRTSASRCATRASARRSPRCSASRSRRSASCWRSPTASSPACHIAVGYPEKPFPTALTRVAGRGDRLRRGVQQAAVRVTAGQHRAPIGRATIGDQLRRHARTQPDKVAFVTYAPERAETTYGELDVLANRYAHLLAGRGVGRGDVVAMLARNGVAAVAAYYGALKLGAAFTVVNPMFRAHEVAPAARPRRARGRARRPGARRPRRSGRPRCCSAPTSTPSWPPSPRRSPTPRSTRTTSPCSSTPAAPTAMPKGVLISHRNYLISTAPAWSRGCRPARTTRGCS